MKDQWQKQRAKKGLIDNSDSDYPCIIDKCVFGKYCFIKIYIKLWLASIFLSLIIFAIVFLTSTSYDLTSWVNIFKIAVQALIIYSIFLNLGLDEYVIDMNGNDSNFNLLKLIIQPFNAIKNKLISNIVNYEYAHLKKNINDTFKKWFEYRSSKIDNIGVFIIRLDRLVRSNNLDVDEGLISLYEDRLYNLYMNYSDDKDIYIMDDLNSIVPDFLLDSLGIKIHKLSSYISNQLDYNMSKNKIKKEIEKNIKDQKKKKVRNVTMEEIIDDLISEQ